MRKLFAGIFLTIILASLVITPTFADFSISQPPNSGVKVQDDVDSNSVLSLVLTNAIAILFTVAAIGFVFMIVWGALDWILSTGDKEKVASARKKITSAVIGLVILSLAFLFIRVLGQIVGLNPLDKLSLPNFQQVVSQVCTRDEKENCEKRGLACTIELDKGNRKVQCK